MPSPPTTTASSDGMPCGWRRHLESRWTCLQTPRQGSSARMSQPWLIERIWRISCTTSDCTPLFSLIALLAHHAVMHRLATRSNLNMFPAMQPGAICGLIGAKVQLLHMWGVVCRLDSKEVVLAAMWDLLTMQCDRHGQNVHLDESAKLTLIDHDQAFGDAWRACGFDSLFLPTTQKHAVNLLGFAWCLKMPDDSPRRSPDASHFNIMHAMDYRCHAPGGKVGDRYPPGFSQCLESISTSTYRQVACCSTIAWNPDSMQINLSQ